MKEVRKMKAVPILRKESKVALANEAVKQCKIFYADTMKECDKELSSIALLLLYDEFGFNKKDLKKFAELFNTMMNEYSEYLKGDVTNGEYAYYRLSQIFPDCDDWISFKKE